MSTDAKYVNMETAETAGSTNTNIRANLLSTTETSDGAKKESSTMHAVRIFMYFLIWYALNLAYNVYNKRALTTMPLYWLVGTLQYIVGSIYVLVVWGFNLRPRPILSWDDIKTLTPLAFLNLMGHLSACVSLGIGAVSFTHIVKAAEPVFTSILSALILRHFFKWPVYVSLVPIIFGVALASLHELDFSWVAFAGAMVSNLSFALRAILGKIKMQKPVGQNMDAANLFGVMTILSLLMGIPLAFAIDGYKMVRVYHDALDGLSQKQVFYFYGEFFLSSATLYLYNEVAFRTLEQVHPITHAVGNTFKRVVIIVFSILIFGNKVTVLGSVGCAIAIVGTLVYSLVKVRYH